MQEKFLSIVYGISELLYASIQIQVTNDVTLSNRLIGRILLLQSHTLL